MTAVEHSDKSRFPVKGFDEQFVEFIIEDFDTVAGENKLIHSILLPSVFGWLLA